MVVVAIAVSVGCAVVCDDDTVVVATDSCVVIVVAILPFIQQNYNVHINFRSFNPATPRVLRAPYYCRCYCTQGQYRGYYFLEFCVMFMCIFYFF